MQLSLHIFYKKINGGKMKLKEIVVSQELEELYEKLVHENWVGTNWEKHSKVPNKAKGTAGEKIAQIYFKNYDNTIESRKNEGHDLIINGHKVEIKFSMAKSSQAKAGFFINPNNWMFNHIEMGKDWDILCLFGINPPQNWPKAHKKKQPWDEQVILLVMKDNLKKIYNTPKWHEIFRKQQGGEGSTNDDWLIDSQSRLKKFMELPFVIKNPTKI